MLLLLLLLLPHYSSVCQNHQACLPKGTTYTGRTAIDVTTINTTNFSKEPNSNQENTGLRRETNLCGCANGVSTKNFHSVTTSVQTTKHSCPIGKPVEVASPDVCYCKGNFNVFTGGQQPICGTRVTFHGAHPCRFVCTVYLQLHN